MTSRLRVWLSKREMGPMRDRGQPTCLLSWRKDLTCRLKGSILDRV